MPPGKSSKNYNSIVEKRTIKKFICYTHPVVFSILTRKGGEILGHFIFFFQRHCLLCIFKSQYVFYTIQLLSIDNCTGNNHFLDFGSSFIHRNNTCISVLSLYCILFHIAIAAMNLQRLIGYFNRCLRCIILRHRP